MGTFDGGGRTSLLLPPGAANPSYATVAQQGYSKVSIRTVDTNVLVLAIASASLLNISELWISFGARKGFRFVAAREIAKALCRERSVALPHYHISISCVY